MMSARVTQLIARWTRNASAGENSCLKSSLSLTVEAPGRAAFNKRFPDDAACARFLFEKRWPNGFICPACGGQKACQLATKHFTYECAACGRQTSVTAGTIFHRSHLDLLTWFQAIYAVASHSNGISALQLQAQLGLGSYKTAWLMLQKLRRAMVDPNRSLLEQLVELDESDVPYRTKTAPIAGGQGRSPVGKLHFIGAIELSPDGHPRRIRLAPLADFSAPSIDAFVTGSVEPSATLLGDGFSSYRSLKGYNHQPKVVGKMAAHMVLHGSIASSPISSAGRSEPTMASVSRTCGTTSKSSSSAGTGDAT